MSRIVCCWLVPLCSGAFARSSARLVVRAQWVVESDCLPAKIVQSAFLLFRFNDLNLVCRLAIGSSNFKAQCARFFSCASVCHAVRDTSDGPEESSFFPELGEVPAGGGEERVAGGAG
jgi:hypothetical protein